MRFPRKRIRIAFLMSYLNLSGVYAKSFSDNALSLQNETKKLRLCRIKKDIKIESVSFILAL